MGTCQAAQDTATGAVVAAGCEIGACCCVFGAERASPDCHSPSRRPAAALLVEPNVVASIPAGQRSTGRTYHRLLLYAALREGGAPQHP